MAYKKFKKSQSDGKTAEDRALERFADIMIEKIKDMDKVNWKKPWFAAGVHPAKNLDGREYNDFNQIMLMFLQQSMGWKTSRYATFDRIRYMNYERDSSGMFVRQKDKDGKDIPDVHVKSGEKSIPVYLYLKFAVHLETNEKIDFDDYKDLSRSEQEKYRLGTYFRIYNVFNLDQTNMKEARPDLYEKFATEFEDKLPEKLSEAKLPEMDALLDKGLWVCPITQVVGPDAYYRPSTDEIVLPSKELFFKDEQFYGTALHEMAHSTGARNRADRPMGGIFGSPEYAREELVAELSSALLCSKMGFSMDVESEIQTQSANYLKSWLGSLQDDTNYIKSVLSDVRRASSFIGDRLGLIGERLDRDGHEADFSDIIEEDKLSRESLLHPSSEKTGGNSLQSSTKEWLEGTVPGLEDHTVNDVLNEVNEMEEEVALMKMRQADRFNAELSPMLRQYAEFKRLRPLLTPLFHVSGGYETYQDDARRISSVLGLTLQKSKVPGPDGNPAVFVTFPDGDLESHKKSLLDNGIPLALLEDLNFGKRDGASEGSEHYKGNGEIFIQAQADEQQRGGGMHR